MERSEIYAGLNDIFRRTLDDPAISLRPETNADDVEGWDSMNHILIIVAIEQRFGVKFQAAETEELKNVGELVHLLAEKLKAA
jgi:acyl carrier protein